MMDNKIDLLLISRQNYLKIIDEHSLDELNTVHLGYRNNLIWNLAHVIAANDSLVNRLHGLPVQMSDGFIKSYSKGTQPEIAVDSAFVEQVRHDLIAQVDWIRVDYNNGKFPAATLKPYTTSYGNTLTNIEEILTFILLHEGLHYGYMLAMKRFLKG